MISVRRPPSSARHDLEIVANRIREGRFQRSLSLLTAGTSIVSGLEVAYEHYRGSYSRRVMYTPVIMSVLLAVAGIAGFFSGRAARTVLRLISALTLGDAAVGFYFHVRGIQRKPGGWRLPMTNMIMGPPVFAPLLFGTSAYLGLIASFLQREEASCLTRSGRDGLFARLLPAKESRELLSAEQDIREGRFQRQVAIVTGVSALLSGFEAFYSHYKNNFRYAVQWTPIILAPALAAAAFGFRKKPPARYHGAAGTVFAGFGRRSRRILLSRPRRASPARWQQASSLQHHVWPADLCPIAVWRSGNARPTGQSAAQEARMKAGSLTTTATVDSALLPRDAQWRSARTSQYAGLLSRLQHAFPKSVLG